MNRIRVTKVSADCQEPANNCQRSYQAYARNICFPLSVVKDGSVTSLPLKALPLDSEDAPVLSEHA